MSQPLTLATKANVDLDHSNDVIQRIYRQVFGNRHLMELDINKSLEAFFGKLKYHEGTLTITGVEHTTQPDGSIQLSQKSYINGIQPMRWAEYSITASLMIVLVFIINGVTDIYILAFAYIIMNLVNSFGAAIDYTNSGAIVAWFWVCAVGALVWQFSLLWSAYLENISPYIQQDNTKDLWGQYFGFITALNVIVTLTYSGFGITNLYHHFFIICTHITLSLIHI